MGKYIKYIPIILLLACKSITPNLLDVSSEVIDIRPEHGYVVLFWPCVTIPYKLQPCFGLSEHPIFLLGNPQIGDKYTLKKIK